MLVTAATGSLVPGFSSVAQTIGPTEAGGIVVGVAESASAPVPVGVAGGVEPPPHAVSHAPGPSTNAYGAERRRGPPTAVTSPVSNQSRSPADCTRCFRHGSARRSRLT